MEVEAQGGLQDGKLSAVLGVLRLLAWQDCCCSIWCPRRIAIEDVWSVGFRGRKWAKRIWQRVCHERGLNYFAFHFFSTCIACHRRAGGEALL
jgi:hypothetical protein